MFSLYKFSLAFGIHNCWYYDTNLLDGFCIFWW